MQQLIGGTLWHIDKNALDQVAAGDAAGVSVTATEGQTTGTDAAAEYVEKYTYQWGTATKDRRVQIGQYGYSGGVTTLTPAVEPFSVTWGQQGREDLSVPLMVSSATLRFRGDSKGALLEEVFDGGDTEYLVVYSEDDGSGWEVQWRGFLATDLWQDNPAIDSETIKLEAIDGLALLENRVADDLLPNVWSHLSVVRDLHALPIEVNMEWYTWADPPIPSDDTLLDPLVDNAASLQLPQTYFYSELTDSGEIPSDAQPVDQRTVLEDLLERFRLQLVQSGGDWHIRQRHRIQPDGTLKRWTWDGTSMSAPSTDDLSTPLPPQEDTQRPRSRVQRLRAVESVYNYQELGELVAGGSFESGKGRWKDQNVGDDPGGSPVPAEVIGYANAPIQEPGTQSDNQLLKLPNYRQEIRQDIPANLYDAGPRGALDIGFDLAATAGTFVYTDIAADDTWHVESRSIGVASDVKPADDQGRVPLNQEIPGAEGTLIIPADTRLPVINSDDNYVGTVTLSAPAFAGDDVLKGAVSDNISDGQILIYWVWGQTQKEATYPDPSDNFTYYGLDGRGDYPQPIDTDEAWAAQDLQLPLHTPGGVNLADADLSFTVGTGIAADNIAYLDHVTMQMVKAGEPIEKTNYIAVDDQYGDTLTLEHRTGDGPTAGHERGLVLDGAPTPTGDWKEGPYSTGEEPTGRGLEELVAETTMAEQRETLDRRTYDVLLEGDELWPHQVVEYDDRLYTITYLQRTFGSGLNNRARVELTELKDAGTDGLARGYSMDTAPTGDGGGSGGTTVIGSQTIEGAQTWSELTGKPSGFFVTNGDGDGYDETNALPTWLVSTVPRTPPPDFTALQYPFTAPFRIDTLHLYADTAPASDFTVDMTHRPVDRL